MSHTMREWLSKLVSRLHGVRVLNKTSTSLPRPNSVFSGGAPAQLLQERACETAGHRQSDLFGLVISEIANPYFPEIIRGFQASAGIGIRCSAT